MNTIKSKCTVSGHFILEVIKVLPDGTHLPPREVASFDNLITDQGLDFMGSTLSYFSYCYVGTGSTAPAFTDTQLTSYLAKTNNVLGGTNTIPGSPPPYYNQVAYVYQFDTGVAAGNLTEIGIGINSADSSAALFSHALILDGGGLPTTITVLSDEILQATYMARMYPPLVDTTGSVTISGVSYNYIMRASKVTTTRSGFSQGWAIGGFSGGPTALTSEIAPSTTGHLAFNGPIGAITGSPSGTAAGFGAAVSPAYASGTLVRTGTITAAMNEGNVPGGILSVAFGWQWGAYQIQFDPVIPKTNLKTLSLTFSHAWDRHII